MQRYEPDFRCFRMYEDPTGDFVLYADAQAALDAKQREIEAMTRQRDEWHNTAEARWSALAEKSEQVNQLQQRIDDVLRECVWAMRLIVLDNVEGSLAWAQAKNFLATPLVQDWLTRQVQARRTG